MQERELEELFRDTAAEAPPATFDELDVARGSRRVTARRRTAAAGGSLVVAGMLIGGVGFGTGLFSPQQDTSTTSAQRERAPQPPSTSEGPGVLMEPAEPSGCGPPDGKLANALVAKLPQVADQQPTSATDCPSGSQAAAFNLRAGPARGSVSVILSPVSSVPQEDWKSGVQPDGTWQVTEKANSGRVLMVRSDPGENSEGAPFQKELPAVAKDLAGQF